MTDPAPPSTPDHDIIGRQASALDSISEVAHGLLLFLKEQAQATEDALKRANAYGRRGSPLPSAEDIRAMTVGLPKEDVEEIEKAVASDNPSEALRLLKEKVQADEVRPPEPAANPALAAQSALAACSLFKNGRAKRDDAGRVMAMVSFVESFTAWMESVVGIMGATPPDESLDGFGRAIRMMALIKNHFTVMDREHPTDPTRRMLEQIFSAFQMDQGTSSVIDIVSYAASTIPELADALMAITGHMYPKGTSGLGRWQMARRVAKDASCEDQALAHLANKLFSTIEFKRSLSKALAAIKAPDEASSRGCALVFLDAMSDYTGPLDQAWGAIALTLGEYVGEPDTRKAQSPTL